MAEDKDPNEIEVTVVYVTHPNPAKLTDPTYFDPMMFAESPAEEIVTGKPGKSKSSSRK